MAFGGVLGREFGNVVADFFHTTVILQIQGQGQGLVKVSCRRIVRQFGGDDVVIEGADAGEN